MINWTIYPLDVFEYVIGKVIVREAPEGSGLEEGDVFLVLDADNSWSAYRNLTVAGEYVFDFKLLLYAGSVDEDTTVSWDIWFYLCRIVGTDPVVLWSGCIRVSL